MKHFYHTKFLLGLFCLLGFQSSFAQSEWLWQDISALDFWQKPMIQVKEARALQLLKSDMAAYLAQAPEEFTSAAQTPLVLSLPRPEGGFSQFRIVYSPVMHPDLAKAYPNIHTFVGQGVDDRGATLRCDITQKGFHASVLTAKGAYYIDPISLKEGETQYISYYRAQLIPHTKGHICLNGDEENEIENTELNGLNRELIANTETGTLTPNVDFGTDLRTYRLALACTGEYAAYHGGTKAGALAGMITSINRVNQVYETDLSVRLIIIPNDTLLIYLSSGTDPYTNSSGSAMLTQNVNTVNSIIGSPNYDIGHVFSTGGGGIAGLGVVCSSDKARGVTGSPAPIGDAFDIDYVAHEVGHQFGANHTFNSTTGACSGNRVANAAYEPGSGTTIMAYAGICSSNNITSNSDAYFHAKSLSEIWTKLGNSTGACAVTTPIQNNVPTLTFKYNGVINVPYRTFFKLTADGADVDNDTISYVWEQYDLGNAGNWNAQVGNAPCFRSVMTGADPTRLYPRQNCVLNDLTQAGEVKPRYARTMKFRCTVRDNRAGGGAVTYNDDLVTLNVVNTVDSFNITYPVVQAVAFPALDTLTIKWNVAQTTAAPINVPLVNILLSTNNGLTFPTVLAANVPNDGAETIILPNTPTTNARVMVEAVDNIFYDVNTKKFTITQPISINAMLADELVTIAPNPSEGIVHLQLSGIKAGTCTATVYDMMGRMVQNVSFEGEMLTLNLENQTAGVYSILVTTPSGKALKKVVLN
ncbi:MAG: reprolysin-like metallopeptidase [Bacteroidia bacterium]